MNNQDTLRNKSLKSTPIRIALLDYLKKHDGAVAQSELQKSLGDFDRVTLYRTLQSFESAGIIHRALVENNETFYALCKDCSMHAHDHQHIHFQCSSCGKVDCIEPQVKIKIGKSDYAIEEYELIAKGLCPNCK